MKPVSKNITQSLKGQKPGGRGAEAVEVSGMKRGTSMTVPGDGSVDSPPGMRHERSAAHYAEPGGRVK